MKGLTWVGVFVAIGIAAGTIAFALTPAHYRAVTALQATVVRHAYDGRLLPPDDQHVDQMLRALFSEKQTEQLIRELGLYKRERDAGRWADALLRFRRGMAFSRHVESAISQRWTVAFEADDPNVAETVSLRLASHIAEEVHEESYDVWGSFGLSLQNLRWLLRVAESEMTAWSGTHGGRTPPAAMASKYEALYREYTDVQNEIELSTQSHYHGFPPLGLMVEVVGTPRVSDGRIGPSLLRFAGVGAAAGLYLGLFTMPPFFWWRRHVP
jgi:hypothetical protein